MEHHLCVFSGTDQKKPERDFLSLWPEDPEQRKIFDKTTKILYGGEHLVTVVFQLRIWAQMHPTGTFSQLCTIMANEIVKEIPAQNSGDKDDFVE